jgi:hypothetical protein
MSRNTVHLYFDGEHWRVRSQDPTIPPRGPYQTYHAADSAAHDLAQELSTDERHHDHGEVMREVCERGDDNNPDDPGHHAGNGTSLSRRVRGAMRRLLRRDRPSCRLVRIGTDRRAALAADKRHWTRTMAEIERLMEDPKSLDAAAPQPVADVPEYLPDDPGDPNDDVPPPVPADLSRELELALRGLPRAGELLVDFWQTAERDGLSEAFDRLSIALADTGRDLSRVRALVDP